MSAPRTWPVMVAAGVTAVVVQCAHAQPTEPSYRTETALVRIDALATDRGRPIPGLDADDFEVRDSGQVQPILSVTQSESLHAMLVLDASSSVAGARLAQLRVACADLIDRLSPDDRVTLVTFSDAVHTLIVDEPASPRVTEALAGVQARGETVMLDALVTALRLVPHSDRPVFIMLFTDGVDTASWTPPAAVLRALARTDVVVYSVAMLPPDVRGSDRRSAGYPSAETWWLPRPSDARTLLQAMASLTGGQALVSPNDRSLRGLFGRVVDEFRQRYIITFTPPPVTRAGWRTLDVRLKGRRGTVTARDGYWAGIR